VHNLCAIKGLKLHLDGARLFNALVATGDKAASYGHFFDGISICLSKGLGAPVGSVLLGSTTMINQARRLRKVLGGGMRQAGFIAAAGIYALDHHVDRLAEDHQHAKALALALAQTNYVKRVMPAETNIVLFDVASRYKAEEIVRALGKKGILCNTTSPQTIRLVTHLDISSSMIDHTIEVIGKLEI
ncbi:MAG: threonine aldolase, partial [Chitinophagaceae bacterium]